jgi:hypothetical protein
LLELHYNRDHHWERWIGSVLLDDEDYGQLATSCSRSVDRITQLENEAKEE